MCAYGAAENQQEKDIQRQIYEDGLTTPLNCFKTHFNSAKKIITVLCFLAVIIP